MALLQLPKHFKAGFGVQRNKPATTFEVDRSDRFGSAIGNAWSFGTGAPITLAGAIDAVVDNTSTNVEAVGSTRGQGIFTDTSDHIDCGDVGDLSDNFTLIIVAQIDSDTANGAIAGWSSDASNNGWAFKGVQGASDFGWTTNFVADYSFTGAVASDNYHTYVVSSNNGTLFVARDNEVYEQAVSVPAAPTGTPKLVLRSGYRNGAFIDRHLGRILFAAVIMKPLSKSEVAELGRNPFRVVKPTTPPVYFVPAAVGGALVVQDLSVSTTITSPLLTQHNAFSVENLAVSTTLTEPALSQHNALLVDALASSTSLTSPAFTEHSALNIDSLAVATALTSPTLVQHNILVVDDLASATSLTEPSFVQHNALSVDSLASAATLTEPALSIAGALSVASLSVSTTLTEAGLTQHNVLIVDSLAVASLLSNASLAGTVSLSVNDLAVGTSISQPTLDVSFAILADNLSVSAALSEPALSQHNVLFVDDLSVNTLLSVVSFGGAVISCLSGYVTIQPKLGGNTTIKPTLSGNVKID